MFKLLLRVGITLYVSIMLSVLAIIFIAFRVKAVADFLAASDYPKFFLPAWLFGNVIFIVVYVVLVSMLFAEGNASTRQNIRDGNIKTLKQLWNS